MTKLQMTDVQYYILLQMVLDFILGSGFAMSQATILFWVE